MAKAKKPSGSATMKAKGLKNMTLWFTEEEMAEIKEAAAREGRGAMTETVKYHALTSIRKGNRK